METSGAHDRVRRVGPLLLARVLADVGDASKITPAQQARTFPEQVAEAVGERGIASRLPVWAPTATEWSRCLSGPQCLPCAKLASVCDQAGFHSQSSPLGCASGDVRHQVRSAPPQWLSTADEVTA